MVAWFSGCVIRAIQTEDGILSWEQVQRMIRPVNPYSAPTGLVTIENTHNMHGGTVYPMRTVREICDGFWRYEGMLAESSLKVLIRYSGRMGRPQLQYGVQVQGKGRAITAPNLCFESVLGVGFGRWDYLTQENAERSVGLLGELVEHVARLPERLPV